MTNLSEIVVLLKADLYADVPSALVLTLPRRGHAAEESRRKAQELAQLLFPEKTQQQAIIAYEKLVPPLRARHLAHLKEEELKRKDKKGLTQREAVKKQGPYDPDIHTFQMPPALPMPVKTAEKEDLKPFFDYLKSNEPFQTENVTDHRKVDHEPGYQVDMIEFNKGVVYADHRMDLCKMVVGPRHIEDLMTSLAQNTHVRHFLLGNNIIGKAGAIAIARYLLANPSQMETWYLAGNMLDQGAFEIFVDAATRSKSIQSLWLKRNPLRAGSVPSICKLLSSCANLTTLDLDQTELTDAGVRELFIFLNAERPALKTIYLNGNGISWLGCRMIAKYLANPKCRLENLYLSNNPLGDVGAMQLGQGIGENSSLLRLSLPSCGISGLGGAIIARKLSSHQSLISLELGQSYATKDLGSRYNYISGEDALNAFAQLIKGNQVLRYLSLMTSGFTAEQIEKLKDIVADSKLHYFSAKSCHQRDNKNFMANRQLSANVKKDLGTSYPDFLSYGGLRLLQSPPEVRVIDSVYRNRDAGLARRKKLVLQKFWDDDDNTMEFVQNFENDDA